MGDVVISVEQAGKKYRLGDKVERYRTLRDSLVHTAKKPVRMVSHLVLGSASGTGMGGRPEFWALKDVSLQVRQGDVLGIIGRNGAGKSTLLKLLSQVTEPTQGCIKIKGRTASLLEVGTGFHPELTGRENIFLNGAILGMSRGEILRKFDEIVAFAEVAQFVDTPVKRYSSGMYLRLAFAVAAHLEPDILLVDEVLAVGDASFQKKCLSKLDDVGQEGRTVIFVSHDMAAISRLCGRAVLLHEGRVVRDGLTQQVIRAYLQSGLGPSAVREWSDPNRAPGNHVVRLRAVRVRNPDGETADAIDIREAIQIEMDYDVLEAGHVLVPNYHLFNEEGLCVFVTADVGPEWRRRPRPVGGYRSTTLIPGNFLAEGGLTVAAAISTMDPVTVHVHERDAVAFHVTDSLDGNSARGDYGGPMPGIVRPLLQWTNQRESVVVSTSALITRDEAPA